MFNVTDNCLTVSVDITKIHLWKILSSKDIFGNGRACLGRDTYVQI